MDQNPGLKDFFESGFHKKYWPDIADDSGVREFAQKILSLLEARNGHILDWRGGSGRFAIWFARWGFDVTLLDFMPSYLAEAKNLFGKEDLSVRLVEADSRYTPPDIQADYAVCLDNSVGFMSELEEIQAFQSLNNALRPKAKLLIDCMNLFFLSKPVAEGMQETQRDDGCTRLSEGHFDFKTSVWHKMFELVKPDGSFVRKPFNQIMYTPQHLASMLENAGFKTERIYGDFEGNPISFDARKIVLVARKY